MQRQGKLFIITAPSGAGKTTLVREVIMHMHATHAIQKVVTYTTRPARVEEHDGKDYFFVTKEVFTQKKNAKFFLETTIYHNHFYGSARGILNTMHQGKSFIMIIDRSGAKVLKKIVPQAVLIWITVPILEELKERLQKRNKQKMQAIRERVALAHKELQEEKQERIFDYHVVNDLFEDTINQLQHIIDRELST